jgi:hypothetical protein
VTATGFDEFVAQLEREMSDEEKAQLREARLKVEREMREADEGSQEA